MFDPQKEERALDFQGLSLVGLVGLEPMFRMLNRRDCPLDRSLVSHEKAADDISATGIRTYVPFVQWSPEALGAGFILPFTLTNSSRFRFADSPLG